MSTSQVLDRTFQLYRGNFWLFAGIAALPPALILVMQLVAIGAGPLLTKFFGSVVSIVTLVVGVALFLVFYLAGYALATGATVHAVSRLHLGSAVSVSGAYGAVGELLFRIIGIMFLVSLMAGGVFMVAYMVVVVPTVLIGTLFGRGAGAIVFIVGGLLAFITIVGGAFLSIRLYCQYSLAVPACVVERQPVMDSLRRSKFLSKESLFRIFLIYLLVVVLGLTLSVALSIPNYIELGVSGGKPSLPFQMWSFIASFLAGTLAGPIGTIAIALVYYDQRVRKEAFDLQLMMEAIGQPAQQQATGAAAPGMG